MSNVAIGKPKKVSGVVYVAPKGTTLPTDATAALDPAFVTLGMLSDDGIENEPSIDTTDVTEMGGTNALTVVSGYSETLAFTMIETTAAGMKLLYGDSSVSGTDGSMTVRHTQPDSTGKVVVCEILMAGWDHVKRLVVPDATVSDRDSITYAASDAVGYGVTLSCNADADGVTMTEYIAPIATAGTTATTSTSAGK